MLCGIYNNTPVLCFTRRGGACRSWPGRLWLQRGWDRSSCSRRRRRELCFGEDWKNSSKVGWVAKTTLFIKKKKKSCFFVCCNLWKSYMLCLHRFNSKSADQRENGHLSWKKSPWTLCKTIKWTCTVSCNKHNLLDQLPWWKWNKMVLNLWSVVIKYNNWI